MDADFLLLHRMRHGDDQAIEDFVRKYYPLILRYCHLHIQDTGYAEDLTQETFARFFRNLSQYQHYGKAANYLYVIAGNLCRDYPVFYNVALNIVVAIKIAVLHYACK